MDNKPIQLDLLVDVPVAVAPVVGTDATKVSASLGVAIGSEWCDPLDVARSEGNNCKCLIREANMILKNAEAVHSLAYNSLDETMWQQYNSWMGKYTLVINSLCSIALEDMKEFRTTVLAEIEKLEEWMDMVLSIDRLPSSVSIELSATAARYLRLRDQLKILEERGESR